MNFITHAADANETLIYAGDENYPPFESIEDNQTIGINIDILRALSKVMGRNAEIRLMNWSEAQQMLIDDKVDALSAMAYSKSRAELFDFSEQTILYKYSFFVKKYDRSLHQLSDATGKTIAVTSGGYPIQLLKPNVKIKLHIVDNYLDGFRQLLAGNVDAVAADTWVGAHTLQENGLSSVIKFDTRTFAEQPGFIVVQKGNTALLNDINEAITKLRKEGTIDEILDRWSGENFVFITEEQLAKRISIIGFALLLLIVIVIIAWIYTLKKQIRSKTAEIQQAHNNLEKRVHDRTLRLRSTQETLRQEHERLSLITEHARMGIVTYQLGKPYLSANRAFCEITGYTADELMSITVEDLTHPDDRVESARLLSKAVSGETQHFTHQKRYLRKNGDIISLRVVNAITHDANGETDLVIGQIEDITPRLAAEAEALQQREQLAHIDRLNLLGEMASGIAHEINQPLTAISLFAQAGKRLLDAGNHERVPDVFDKLSQHAQRAGTIIERIQTMTHKRESTKIITDCNNLTTKIVELAEAESRIRDIEIAVEIGDRLPLVAVDNIQIQQVALNLLRNGMESMRSVDCCNGDTITLKTTLREDGDVDVSVIDSGCGVSDESADTLFSPFLTTKNSGMGMGLSISRAIVIAHGGQLNFQNNDTAGATFTFNLPAAKQAKQDR